MAPLSSDIKDIRIHPFLPRTVLELESEFKLLGKEAVASSTFKQVCLDGFELNGSRLKRARQLKPLGFGVLFIEPEKKVDLSRHLMPSVLRSTDKTAVEAWTYRFQRRVRDFLEQGVRETIRVHGGNNAWLVAPKRTRRTVWSALFEINPSAISYAMFAFTKERINFMYIFANRERCAYSILAKVWFVKGCEL